MNSDPTRPGARPELGAERGRPSLRSVVFGLTVGGALVTAAAASPARAGAGTPSPADWRDVSIYQIVTDRFFNGDPSNDAVEGSFNPADGARNHGGDWSGIEQKLDYIAGLGATAIWISPVQTNAHAAYHGYHIQDFFAFSPHFGGTADLTSLIDAAHARGIYVILDVIANHGGDLIDSGDSGFPSFENPGTYSLRWRDSGNRAAAPFDDLAMYHNNGSIGDFSDPEQILGELFGLDDLRTEDAGVRADLIAAHQWLIQNTDADGFRVDTVKHVELDFWQEFGPQVRAFAADSVGKSDFFMFGEVFDGSPVENGKFTGTVAGGPFALDSVLWYPMYFTSGGVFRSGDPTQWLSSTLADSTHYEPLSTGRNVNFLDNHDNGRFVGFGSPAQRDDAKLRTALTWQHTSLGIPVVYYGTEQEFDGGADPWNREDMWDGQWDFGPSLGDNFDMTAPIFRDLRRLNELRAAWPALRRGSQEDIWSEAAGAGLYAYYRRPTTGPTVLVVVNTASSSRELTFDPDFPAGTITDGLSGRTVPVPAAGTISLTLGGLSGAVFSNDVVPRAPWVEHSWPPHDGILRSTGGELRVAFDTAMDTSSVEAALSIEPATAFSTQWIGPTLLIRPAPAWGAMTRYRVSIAADAAAAGGGATLGAEFSFEFETGTSLAGISTPTGYSAHQVPGDDLQDPRSLEAGTDDTGAPDRLLLGDTGWDRVVSLNDRGFAQAEVVDGMLSHPASVAADAWDGIFDGDLLVADSNTLLRVRGSGGSDGQVVSLASLPASADDWIVAIDPSGAYGGSAFVGRPGADSVWRVDANGSRTSFATGLAGVNGLAFGPGGSFGQDLYVLTGSGVVLRLHAGGGSVEIASHASLTGARSLALDPIGSFGGDLYTVHSGNGSLLRVAVNGAVTPFATGLTPSPGGDALAFDRFGDLAIVENDGSTRRILKIMADNSDSVVTQIPAPVGGVGITLVGPNPFREFSRVHFVVPDDGVGAISGCLSIHDVRGRRIAVPWEDTALPGPLSATWNGRDDDGSAVAPGVYFVRLQLGAREYSHKLVRLSD